MRVNTLHLRGTGRTTRRLQSLKPNGIFIVNDHREVDYTKALAYRIGRSDVKIYTKGHLDHGRLMGLDISDIGIDHHVDLNESQRTEAMILRSRIKGDQ